MNYLDWIKILMMKWKKQKTDQAGRSRVKLCSFCPAETAHTSGGAGGNVPARTGVYLRQYLYEN